MIDRPVKREKIHPPAIYVGNPTSPTLTSHRPRLLSNSPYSHPRFPQQVVEKSKTEDMEKKGKGKKGKIYKESDPSFVTRPQNAPKNPKHDRKENAKRRKKTPPICNFVQRLSRTNPLDYNAHSAITAAASAATPTSDGSTIARSASDVVEYTRLKPIVDELVHMPVGIGSSSPRFTNVISAQL